jgi:hypothetical protein
LFPYGVTIGCLTLLFLVLLLALSTNDALTPGICMMFCLVLFTLYLTGLVETGVQLFGNGHVAQNCQTYVNDVNDVGPGVNTLAWLEENNICQFLTIRKLPRRELTRQATRGTRRLRSG